MGVNLKDLFDRKNISLQDLSGKIITIDTFNMLYQFLTTIRTRDGQLLTDHNGNVTSHLIGILSRSSAFLENNIKPIFVFDGKPPALKLEERHRRAALKNIAVQKYEEAVEAKNIENMKKFGARTARLDNQMINDAKKLIQLLGLPIIEAPSEGESQCARIVKNGDAWAVASQDYDSLLQGTPRLIQNLSLSGKRKIKGVLGSIPISPVIIELEENLKKHNLTQDKLIALSLLVGTDYNYGGIHGIGPKKALKIVQEYKEMSDIFIAVKWKEHFDIEWQELFNLIKNIPVTDEYNINFGKILIDELYSFLVDEHDFDKVRVNKAINMFASVNKQRDQKGLGVYFS